MVQMKYGKFIESYLEAFYISKQAFKNLQTSYNCNQLPWSKAIVIWDCERNNDIIIRFEICLRQTDFSFKWQLFQSTHKIDVLSDVGKGEM